MNEPTDPRGILRASTDAAAESIEQAVREAGGSPVGIVVVAIADGVTPNGGITAISYDPEDGPEEILSMILHGAEAYARSEGIGFAVIPGTPGAQG